MSYLLVQGSASRLPLRDESVQCVVTSPPYWGLRQYAGEQREVWGGDVDCTHEWEALPTAEGYAGTARWQHSENGRGEEQSDGKRLREQVSRAVRPEAWTQVERGGFCACGAWYGALGLEPTPELYVEHMVAIFREVRRVLRRDGTLWLNLGDSYSGSWAGHSMRPEGGTQREGGPGFQPLDSRVPARVPNVPGLKPKDLVGIPWLVAFALRVDGWYLRSDIIWAKPNPMPESVTDRPTKAHEYLFLLSKSERYYYDADAIREPHSEASLERYTYAPSSYAVEHADVHLGGRRPANGVDHNPAGRNKRTVWNIATQPYAGAHFATYPEQLVEPCILAGSSPKACGVCGAPWERVTERMQAESDREPRGKALTSPRHDGNGWNENDGRGFMPTTIVDTGWQPTCGHNDGSGQSVIIDPFNGSGTTGRVAIMNGRSYVGLDISAEYLTEQAIARIDPLAGAAQLARNYDGGEDTQAVLPL